MPTLHVESLHGLTPVECRSHSTAPPTTLAKRRPDFDPEKFLATIGVAGKVVAIPEKQTVFMQGDAADSCFYIQEGRVRLTILSRTGKEATLDKIVSRTLPS